MTPTVPVLWVSRHPDRAMARGYADQGLLEAMLNRSLWTPPDPVVYEHHEVVGDDWPDVGTGAVVVLPARHHADPDDVRWFRRRLNRLRWHLVILAGDEEWTFPWQEVPERQHRRVWTMQPIPAHAALSGLLPGGWYPDTDRLLATEQASDYVAERPLDFMFAGQITHERRVQAEAAMRAADTHGRADISGTTGYLQEALPRPLYFVTMAASKVVPCPSGPMHVDTARTFEALEAGCIPVCDSVAPHSKHPPFDYWTLLFGPDHPLPVVADWDEFPDLLADLLDGWTAKANRVFAFWQRWKRDTTRRLDAQVRSLAHAPRSSSAPDDVITVLVTASPTPSHPSLDHIVATIESVREQLPTAEVLISVDGVRAEDEHRRGDYDEWTRRLLWKANTEWHNVLPVVMPEWLHQAGCTARLLEMVDTPLVLFMEHDTPLVGDSIPWPALVQVLAGHGADRVAMPNVVRFHHEAEVLDVHEYLMLDADPLLYPTDHGAVPLRRTMAWWQRPHLARADFYRRLIGRFTDDSRSMIEDPTYSLLESAVLDHGERGWQEWGVTIYQPSGDMKRSTHLDGRGGDPKHAMWSSWR